MSWQYDSSSDSDDSDVAEISGNAKPELQDGQIRVLDILPSSTVDSIEAVLTVANCGGSIEHRYYNDAPPTRFYTALSYEWGLEEPMRRIKVNGQEQQLRPNLHQCLRSIITSQKLAQSAGSRFMEGLWIDALCINQQDPSEKIHQVKMMRRIFSCATRVIVWLGPTEAFCDVLHRVHHAFDEMARDSGLTTRYFLSRIKNFDKLLERILQQLGSTSLELIRAVESLAKSGYWERLWVMQEYKLARDVHLLFGASTVTASFWFAIYAWYRARSTEPVLGPERILNLRVAPFGSGFRLGHVLQLSKDAKCALIEDRLYGILSLIADGSGIAVEYSLDFAKIITSALGSFREEDPRRLITLLDRAFGRPYVDEISAGYMADVIKEHILRPILVFEEPVAAMLSEIRRRIIRLPKQSTDGYQYRLDFSWIAGVLYRVSISGPPFMSLRRLDHHHPPPNVDNEDAGEVLQAQRDLPRFQKVHGTLQRTLDAAAIYQIVFTVREDSKAHRHHEFVELSSRDITEEDRPAILHSLLGTMPDNPRASLIDPHSAHVLARMSRLFGHEVDAHQLDRAAASHRFDIKSESWKREPLIMTEPVSDYGPIVEDELSSFKDYLQTRQTETAEAQRLRFKRLNRWKKDYRRRKAARHKSEEKQRQARFQQLRRWHLTNVGDWNAQCDDYWDHNVEFIERVERIELNEFPCELPRFCAHKLRKVTNWHFARSRPVALEISRRDQRFAASQV